MDIWYYLFTSFGHGGGFCVFFGGVGGGGGGLKSVSIIFWVSCTF